MFTVLRGRPTNDVVDGWDHVRALGERDGIGASAGSRISSKSLSVSKGTRPASISKSMMPSA